MKKSKPPAPGDRSARLAQIRNLKMAQSAHAYVRGSTTKFYEWHGMLERGAAPAGPPVWICGDCHVGNLGPVANASGRIEIQIRDLDQTVIGNPAHDLLRLSLSLASAARGSDLPGVTTAKMLEAVMEGYELAFAPDFHEDDDVAQPASVHAIVQKAAQASWATLAEERIEDASPAIPLGQRFWPVSAIERREIKKLFAGAEMHRLATMLSSRDDAAEVELLDVAYWMKGCSSLGRLRYAALLQVAGKKAKRASYCLMDLKEAVHAAAPVAPGAKMPAANAERVVEGARHLAPFLGKRMRAVRLLDKGLVVRELLPQDLKLEIDSLTRTEAVKVARYLAAIVGKAHSRQMDVAARAEWQRDLKRNRGKSLDAPAWLWSAVVELLGVHERAYLDHCRQFALDRAQG